MRCFVKKSEMELRLRLFQSMSSLATRLTIAVDSAISEHGIYPRTFRVVQAGKFIGGVEVKSPRVLLEWIGPFDQVDQDCSAEMSISSINCDVDSISSDVK